MAIGRIVCSRGTTTIGINDEIATLQELVSDIDGSLQIATTILLQIEDQVLHAQRLQLTESCEKLLMGCGAKVTNTDIADAGTNDIGSIDGVDRNLVTHNCKLKRLANALAHHTQLHLRPFRTTKALHDLLLRHLYTCNSRIVHRDDAIASDDAHTL